MYTNRKCSFIQEDDEPTDWREIGEDFDMEVDTDMESDICYNYSSDDGEETKKEKKKKKCNRISSDSDTNEETQLMKKNKIISDSSDSEAKEGEKKTEIDIVSEANEGEKKSEIVAVQLRKPTYVTNGKFKCPDCDFVGKSTGKVYSHMVDAHGMANFTCDYCKFTTKNKTSFYNHNTRYCRKLKK